MTLIIIMILMVNMIMIMVMILAMIVVILCVLIMMIIMINTVPNRTMLSNNQISVRINGYVAGYGDQVG